MPPVLFDQHSRYQSLAAAVRAVLPDGGTVLDVGSGRLGLLRRYLPGHRVTCVDPLLAGTSEDGLLGVDFRSAGFAAGAFDLVCSVDVLEHVPAAERGDFLDAMLRIARRAVVVSAPFEDAGEAAETDARVDAAYRHKHGRGYPWLDEHHAHGLPNLAATQRQFEAAGLEVVRFGNGHAPWLRDLLGLHVTLLDEAEHLPLLERIGARFAERLAAFDHLPPVYRQVLIACRGLLPALPELADDPEIRRRAAAAWADFRAFVDAELGRHADGLVRARRDGRQAARTGLEALRRDAAATRARLEAERDAIRRAQQEQASAARLERDALAAERVALRAERDDLAAKARMHWQRTRQLEAEVESLRRSLSWRATAPARWALRLPGQLGRGTRAALLRGAQAGARRLGLRGDLEWKLKAAFFTTLRPLLKSSREYREFLEVRQWRDAARAERHAPAPALEPGHPQLDDVLVFAVIDWSFRTQRPQHLARELAKKGHRVFYLSPGFVDLPAPGYTIRRLDDSLPLHEVRLHAAGRPRIYDGGLRSAAGPQLEAGLRRLLGDAAARPIAAIVDHPGWVDLLAILPRAVLVYDCMDNHHGFPESGAVLAAEERRLLATAEVVVSTSDWLHDWLRPLHPHVRLVRNGCDPEHFVPAGPRRPGARPVIGYFGALATWFDRPLVRRVAERFPAAEILLVGADTAGVGAALDGCSNVRMTREVPYAELLPLVQQMDVLIIPFVIDDLTRATNPVKAYEALAAGIPVVATPMPELMQAELEPFVRVAGDAEAFCAAIEAALAEAGDPARRAARVAYARGQSWAERAGAFEAAIATRPERRAGVVVVSWNGLELTRRCVASVLDDPAAIDLELVIVDNASTDGTPAWLDTLADRPRITVIRNGENRGFAAACNQGLAAAAARGVDLLVILNNDLVVTPGWLRTLDRHLRRDPTIGLLGPVTNNIGNEARIATAYADLDAMEAEQAAYTGAHAGRTFELPVLAFFCVAMPRAVFEEVGGLDERFGTGFFEDDDYCQRVRAGGRRVVCAEDVFVHHELSASFDRIDQDARRALFERNRAYYESKWGPWQPHRYRGRRGDEAATG
jgi:GT2 family glycosyltransferase/glycosyltransferase involved in cell wall biosynthesis